MGSIGHNANTRNKLAANTDSPAQIGFIFRFRNADIEANIPVGRLGTSEDIAALAAFLCSEKAGFLAAANINADGGASAGLL